MGYRLDSNPTGSPVQLSYVVGDPETKSLATQNAQVAGTWKINGDWKQKFTPGENIMCFTGTATAEGGNASLARLAFDITGRVDDYEHIDVLMGRATCQAATVKRSKRVPRWTCHGYCANFIPTFKKHVTETAKTATTVFDKEGITFGKVDKNLPIDKYGETEVNRYFVQPDSSVPSAPVLYSHTLDCTAASAIVLARALITTLEEYGKNRVSVGSTTKTEFDAMNFSPIMAVARYLPVELVSNKGEMPEVRYTYPVNLKNIPTGFVAGFPMTATANEYYQYHDKDTADWVLENVISVGSDEFWGWDKYPHDSAWWQERVAKKWPQGLLSGTRKTKLNVGELPQWPAYGRAGFFDVLPILQRTFSMSERRNPCQKRTNAAAESGRKGEGEDNARILMFILVAGPCWARWAGPRLHKGRGGGCGHCYDREIPR